MSRYFYVGVQHVNCTRVNKIEAKYKVLSLNVKLSEIHVLRLRATFINCLYFIWERKFYSSTYVKNTRQWTSTLRTVNTGNVADVTTVISIPVISKN